MAACPFEIKIHQKEPVTNKNHKGLRPVEPKIADPATTTPHNCTCTTICSCGEDCDPGNPIPIGETRDWCHTGELLIRVGLLLFEYHRRFFSPSTKS